MKSILIFTLNIILMIYNVFAEDVKEIFVTVGQSNFANYGEVAYQSTEHYSFMQN